MLGKCLGVSLITLATTSRARGYNGPGGLLRGGSFVMPVKMFRSEFGS